MEDQEVEKMGWEDLYLGEWMIRVLEMEEMEW